MIPLTERGDRQVHWMAAAWLVIPVAVAVTMLMAWMLTGGSNPRLRTLPPALRFIQSSGARVVKKLPAVAPGLSTYLIKGHGRYTIVYVTQDGKFLVVGTVLNAQGKNLTRAQAARHIPKPGPNKLWVSATASTWAAVGVQHSTRIPYELVKTKCPYCHWLWQADQAYEKEDLHVRYLLVTILGPSSRPKAAAVLETGNPGAAIQRNWRGYDADGPGNDDGVVTALASSKAPTLKTIAANERFINVAGIADTPGLLYEDARDQVHRVVGLSRLARLPESDRMPAQPITTPALEPFK